MNLQHPLLLRRGVLAMFVAMAVTSTPLQAQSYPEKPVTLVVPFPPGAVTDRVGRALALEMSKRLGQPVVVENVGGASGTLAGQKVLRAQPDGYTLLLGTVNDMMMAPIAMKQAGYAAKDFTPIARLFSVPTILVAHPSFPANNSDELVEYAKKNNGVIPLGATGMATLQTFGGIMFANAAGFKFNVIAYKGGGPLMTDLVGGHVQVGTIALSSALSLIRQGKLKSLGVISLKRDPTAPEIATVNEGKVVKGVEADLWGGLAAPPNLPPAIVAKLSAVMREVLADQAFRETEARNGNVLVEYADPNAFRQFLVKDDVKLRAIAATVTIE
ncbi:Bug family tripartite tricarboxylate transporter substrate binding protein [Hydrogenophaga sp.]|uniref:Bug family tripartite tricarboxylate transporter substrate binding protein n=1 Tax=Hydrogenophaga sp. TaxID=1904254 RepID=UPI003F6F526A